MKSVPGMKVAIPHWRGRVSPVFDVAGSLLVVETTPQYEHRRSESWLNAIDPLERARQVSQLGIDVLICGAISKPLETALSSAGVRVIADICGNVEEVLAAFEGGEFPKAAFLMPGCCRRRRRLRGGSVHDPAHEDGRAGSDARSRNARGGGRRRLN